MDRAHPEQAAAARHPEVDDLQDHRHRLDDEDHADQRQNEDLAGDQGGHGERRAQSQRAGVADEDLGRMDVEPEEPKERADDQCAEEREVGLGRGVQQRDEHVRHERDRSGPARQPVEAIGDIDAVGRGDDGERREEDVQPRLDRQWTVERHRDGGDRVGLLDLVCRDEGDDREPDQLLAGLDPLPRPRVQVVIERPERTDARERSEWSEGRSVRLAKEEIDAQDHDDEKQSAHRGRAFLDEVTLGTLLADALAEPDRLQEADVRRHQDHDQGECEQEALDQLHGHPGTSPWLSRRPSTTRSSPIPRDALTRTTSPSRSRGSSVSSAASASGTRWIRERSRPASAAPSAMPTASAPTTISSSATLAAASPTA